MHLLFDIGNTRIKWGYASGDKIHSTASLAVVDVSPTSIQKAFLGLARPESIWISNVGSKKMLDIVTQCCEVVFKLEPRVLTIRESCLGINNSYLTQDTLGVDRWVAALGARAVLPDGHIIIIDAGTAVTIDWLSKQDSFEGGVILPGFNLMHNTLIENTVGIKSDYSQPHKVIGRTTEECVNSGVSYGLVGAIERIVYEIQQDIAEPSTILLTGGSAPMIEGMSKLKMKVIHDLVLLGVASVATEPL